STHLFIQSSRHTRSLPSFPTRRSSDLPDFMSRSGADAILEGLNDEQRAAVTHGEGPLLIVAGAGTGKTHAITSRIAWLIASKRRSEEHTSELQSRFDLVCRLLLEKKKI